MGGGMRRGMGGGGFARARSFDMRGPDQRFTLEIDFMTAARGGSTWITMPDGNVARRSRSPRAPDDGQVIRLRGRAAAPAMGDERAGDALLTLIVAEDPEWRRDGGDPANHAADLHRPGGCWAAKVEGADHRRPGDADRAARCQLGPESCG